MTPPWAASSTTFPPLRNSLLSKSHPNWPSSLIPGLGLRTFPKSKALGVRASFELPATDLLRQLAFRLRPRDIQCQQPPFERPSHPGHPRVLRLMWQSRKYILHLPVGDHPNHRPSRSRIQRLHKPRSLYRPAHRCRDCVSQSIHCSSRRRLCIDLTNLALQQLVRCPTLTQCCSVLLVRVSSVIVPR